MPAISGVKRRRKKNYRLLSIVKIGIQFGGEPKRNRLIRRNENRNGVGSGGREQREMDVCVAFVCYSCIILDGLQRVRAFGRAGLGAKKKKGTLSTAIFGVVSLSASRWSRCATAVVRYDSCSSPLIIASHCSFIHKYLFRERKESKN